MELQIPLERFGHAVTEPEQLPYDGDLLMIPNESFIAPSAVRLAGAPTASGRARSVVFALLGVILLICSSIMPLRAQAGTAPAVQWNVPCDPPSGVLQDHGQVCALLSVPLDYRNPADKQITVAVSMIKAADPSQRRGVLLLNSGGPGGPGLDMPRVMYALLQNTPAQAVLDKYDLIGFDPRFVGHSTPATCGLTSQQAVQALVPLEQNHSFEATVAYSRQVASGCIQHIGADTVPFATTANTARDMDAIRQALGEDTISYFAWSYGSYLGAVYASLYPDRTDRIVIDSNVDPNWLWRTMFREWGPGGTTRFADFANWAAANDATYHFGSTSDQVTAHYFQLYRNADAHPFPYQDALPDGTLVNGPMFRELTFGGLANDADFAGIAALWNLATEATGNAAASRTVTTAAVAGTNATSTSAVPPTNPGSQPVAVLPPKPADNLAASAIAVVCDDIEWSHSVSLYQKEYESDSEQFPLFGALGSNIWPCAFWPNAPVEPPVQITSSGPQNILMLQNLRDPNTPYSGALQMHQALGERSRLVSVDGGGHAIYGFSTNTCVTGAATSYLSDGVFPDTDVFCPAEPSASAAQNIARGQSRRAVRRLISPLPHVGQ